MNIEEHLRVLADDPSNREARRFLSGIAARRVATQLYELDLDQRPDLAAIAESILAEHCTGLTPQKRASLVPVIQSVVDGVFDDDEATGVTELFKDWQAKGRVGGDTLFDVLLVPVGKRLRGILGRQQFGSLQHKVQPGQLLGELFEKLKKSGIPDTLEDRKQFYWYAEKVLKNLLIDMQRHDHRVMRDVAKQEPIDDLMRALDESGKVGGKLSVTPDLYLDLTDAIESLPKNLREAVRYRYIWGWQSQEIQAKLHVSRATVTRWLGQGLASLRKILAEGGYAPPPEQP